MPNPEFKHVGTVEMLKDRIYKIDPYADDTLATTVIVEAGSIHPLMFDGYSYLWTMRGVLNGQFLRRGDGLFIATKHANAMLTNIHVEFPSRLYGPDDWKELVEHCTAIEGHPEQRLRITLIKEEV
jgi:hypothetical protein